MRYGSKLAEGKTKIVYAHPEDPELVILVHKDAISAGDGARRNEIPGKGALSGRTAANVFCMLNAAGVPTHFVAAPEPTVMIARRCAMIPVEVVMRRRATGSFLKRHPDVAEGTLFNPVLVEFFLKDDARHDPQVTPQELVAQGIASADEIAEMTEQGRRVFGLLEHAWRAQDVALIDLKIEFGRDARGRLLVADMIDNDSWRLWPGGDKQRMLDKQIYRNMTTVTAEGLEALKQKYAQVAEMTERFCPR
ncbi:phosphoribosylaminoimidazolesuccinocarboxamide synthase [Kallotenue papyrolyticum]|uniref:phosphoribosylaminoimidazolesuccinocarboxamide synthase n=1 Tax=Kallotenue papyrolyticum TaxID=1325125 RepID=UPI00046F950D|nr:phosphoribosylaminoimidazolesuccinocarboxamide synthase [Kallotenue papyrolyticum]